MSLQQVASELGQRLHPHTPMGYDRGRLRMRDALMDVLACSKARAEHMVSSMVAKGFVRYEPHPQFRFDRAMGRWIFTRASS